VRVGGEHAHIVRQIRGEDLCESVYLCLAVCLRKGFG
jgi:hypothetical protein